MGSLPNEQRFKLDNVAIIGAGPSGLAAAKYLLAERAFSRIVIFEQRSTVGGLWNHVPLHSNAFNNTAIPQPDPKAGLDEPNRASGVDSSPSFLSAIYDRLETNIPRQLMGFSDLDWPPDCQLFPMHNQVLDYLKRYAEDVEHLIHYSTQVLDVCQLDDRRWSVKTRSLSSDQMDTTSEQIFDAVLVANGHFNVPYVPSVPGIEAWNEAYPGTIVHSMFYRRPENYTGRKVIIVGSSASGLDISSQIAPVCEPPLLQSQRSEGAFGKADDPLILAKPEIVEYIIADRTVRFSDGTSESNVDAILYCTGYFYSFPFLKSLMPAVVTHGEHVEHTYQHVFYRPQPSLAFLVLNQRVIPFPLAEVQCAVIARVWSGRLTLPSESEMEEWEQNILQESGGGRNFHLLRFPSDFNYINSMYRWAMSADQPSDSQSSELPNSLTNGHISRSRTVVGKEPPRWGELEYWTRERFQAIRKAYREFGEERHSKLRIEDVGFDIEPWKRENKEDAKKMSHLVTQSLRGET